MEFKAVSPPSVEIEEMAFAIALFVAAGNGKISPPHVRNSRFSLISGGDVLSDSVILGARTVLGGEEQRTSEEVSLASAVAVLWHHYERDARQQAICARLVAFYSLMARSKGALLAPWLEESAVNPREVVLTPAIIEAVATASIGENGQFDDPKFRALVQSFDGGDPRPGAGLTSVDSLKRTARKAVMSLPVTAVVQQLSRHLCAFQACVARNPDVDGIPQFPVIERLCGRVATVSGTRALQPLLSRALLAARTEFPWLGSTASSGNGVLEGLDRIQPPPDLQEVARCELAILGAIVELLRSFLGDGITVQLLRTLWPLTTLNSPDHDPDVTREKTI